MATYDNKIWLLKNIRDAFIATDDTGLCEIVMAGEDFSKIFQNKALEKKRTLRDRWQMQPSTSKAKEGIGYISEEENDREIVTQYEPYPDMDDSEEDDPIYPGSSYVRPEDGGPRYRTNTTIWLDKKEQALKKAAKIKVIKWEEPTTPLTTDQISEYFTKMEVTKPEKQKSLLAELIKTCPDLPHRQYLEYAKFDGTAQLGMPIKSFKIFMTMLPEKQQNYPLVVCVIANAKIKDLIGFTCYKYSIEHPEITLGSVHEYGLCIAEDDGDVDWAFPCLDANEPCSKFGFTCLGLIELKQRAVVCPASIPMPEDGISGAFQIFPKVMDSGHSIQNPSRHNTGGSQTSEAVLSALKAISEDKKSRGGKELSKLKSHILATEAPQYKSYKVLLLRKVRANTSVQLGISLDRIEIEPLITHKHAFWSKSKYFMHSIDAVAWCQILETKANKTTFRIIYSPSHNSAYAIRNTTGNQHFFHLNTTYKIHDFECEHEMGKEIVDRINTILDLRNSSCRREYKAAKEKKLQTRKTSHTKHLS